MKFEVDGGTVEILPDVVIVAGFTGRDATQVRAHLDELAELGVPVPPTVPAFYPVPPELLIQSSNVTTWSADTSGEAEIALMSFAGSRLVTLASDHTDRALEAHDIHTAKLACPKVMATTAWRYEEVAGHWDDLILRSWVADGVKYQDGVAAELLPPTDLASRIVVQPPADCFVMLTGTVAAIGGIRPSSRFSAELTDPVLGRSIELSYEVTVTPISC